MVAQEHNKLLGILYLVNGGLSILGLLSMLIFLPVFFSTMPQTGRDAQIATTFVTVIMIVVGVVNLSLGALDLAAGYGLLKRKSWARIVAIVAAIPALIGIPLGTALGIYTLWFLLGEKGKRFYLGGDEASYLPPPPPQFWKQQ